MTTQETDRLWEETRKWRQFDDELVAVRAVSEEEMRELNERYRGKGHATNVLTFSYDGGEHDMAVCLVVAAKEAQERQMELRDYVALLMVHGFLHVVGMDHERSDEEMEQTREAERAILQAAGFESESLYYQ